MDSFHSVECVVTNIAGLKIQRLRGTRLFHQIAVIVLTTATIAYFSMASDLGATPVVAEFSRGNTGTRQIWVSASSCALY